MTSAAMARSVLKMAALSVLWAWLVWALTLLAIYLLMWVTASVSAVRLPKPLGWWYFPVTLVGPWIAVTLSITAGLTGRMQIWAKAFCAIVAAAVALTLVSQYVFSPPMQRQIWHFLVAAAGVTLVAVAAWAVVTAKRRKLIDAVAVYFYRGGVGRAEWARCAHLRWPFGRHFRPTFSSLAWPHWRLPPWAMSPLALAWNRVR